MNFHFNILDLFQNIMFTLVGASDKVLLPIHPLEMPAILTSRTPHQDVIPVSAWSDANPRPLRLVFNHLVVAGNERAFLVPLRLWLDLLLLPWWRGYFILELALFALHYSVDPFSN